MSATLDVAQLQSDLCEVEFYISEVLQDRSVLVTRLGRHTAAAGGKRLRPMLCLLAGAYGDPARRDQVVRTAAGLELIHMATLVHDDVVDTAPVRRGQPAVSALWGNGLSVLTGDWLFASSFELLYSCDDPNLIRAVARMVRELCAGAIEEAELAGTLPHDLQPYFDRIYRKTAVFLETACKAGAMASGAPAAVQDALAAFGRRVGLAFQIIDDLLDFTGDPARTGKPVGGDLKGGIATLPMLLGRRDRSVRRLLDRTFGHADLTEAEVLEVRDTLERAGALAQARQMARDLAEQGKRALAPLRTAGSVAELGALADLAVERDR